MPGDDDFDPENPADKPVLDAMQAETEWSARAAQDGRVGPTDAALRVPATTEPVTATDVPDELAERAGDNTASVPAGLPPAPVDNAGATPTPPAPRPVDAQLSDGQHLVDTQRSDAPRPIDVRQQRPFCLELPLQLPSQRHLAGAPRTTQRDIGYEADLQDEVILLDPCQ